MLKKSQVFFVSFFILLALLVGEFQYLHIKKQTSSLNLSYKKSFVKLTGLPDLAIANESKSSRHRSLNSIGNIYATDGILREYDRSSFVLNHASSL